MPLGRGRHICCPYKAAKSPRCLILLSLHLLSQISKRFPLNFRKIFCFGIVKRRHLWYDADKNKDVPTRGLCALLGASFLFIPPARQMCDAARFNGIGKGANEVWKTLPSARPPPGCTAPGLSMTTAASALWWTLRGARATKPLTTRCRSWSIWSTARARMPRARPATASAF